MEASRFGRRVLKRTAFQAESTILLAYYMIFANSPV
jgi:hypothetical protein